MKKDGFIIPMVLMLVSIAVVFVTYMYQQGSIFVPYQSTMLKREQARQLALGGVEIACAQLAITEEQKKDTQQAGVQTQGQAQNQKWHSFLKEMLPKLNKWQTFTFKQAEDGINGEISLAIASEAGKININQIYDFTNKKFKGEWKQVMQELFGRMQKQKNISGNLFDSFEKFLKERHAMLNDATDLLQIKQFQPFASSLFFQQSPGKKDEKSLYLTDIFTVYGKKDKIQPWLLSLSMSHLLNFIQPNEMSNEMVQTLMKNFKASINWKQDWPLIGKPRYAIELTQLPKGLEASFDTTFDPSLFSVVSYGKVGDIVQKVYAIVSRSERTVKNKQIVDITIKKLYWI